jgi:hypothetical protein
VAAGVAAAAAGAHRVNADSGGILNLRGDTFGHFVLTHTQKTQAEQETHADGSTVNCWAFAAALVRR